MVSLRNLVVVMALALGACVPSRPAGAQAEPQIIPPPQSGFLSGPQISQMVRGNTISGVTAGAAWDEYHTADGTVYGRGGTGDYVARWYVAGNALCYDYPGTSSDACWTVRASSNPVYLTNTLYVTNIDTGVPLSPLTLRPGNPFNLGGGIVPIPGGVAQALVGNTVSGTTSAGAQWHEYHQADGTIRGYATDQGNYIARYYIQGDQVCYDYAGTSNDACWRVRVSGNQVYGTLVGSGRVETWTLRYGNALGL